MTVIFIMFYMVSPQYPDQPALCFSLISAYDVPICHVDNAYTVQLGHLCLNERFLLHIIIGYAYINACLPFIHILIFVNN